MYGVREEWESGSHVEVGERESRRDVVVAGGGGGWW